MPRRIPLSRAAQLVGVKRRELQKQIQDGHIPAFEGTVELGDLLRIYPQAQMHNNTMLERVQSIVEHSVGKLHRMHHDLPPAEVLSARVTSLAEDLVAAKNQVRWYAELVDDLRKRFSELERDCPAGMIALRDWLLERLDHRPDGLAGTSDQLLVKEQFLRTMSAVVRLLPSGREFPVEGARSLLEAGLQAGLPLEYGCNNGSCGLCRARVLSGEIRKLRHHDYVLSEAEKGQGYCLMCSFTPVSDVVIEAQLALGPADLPMQRIKAKVHKIERLADDVLMLQIRTPRTKRLRFFAGQSVTLAIAQDIAGDFAIASCPCDEMNLEFHVTRRDSDAFFEYTRDRLRKFDDIMVEGPKGEFVLDEASQRPILFLVADDGFAPAKSLIEHAMALENAEHTRLYWFTHTLGSHYLGNLCRAWTDSLDGFEYTPLYIDTKGGSDFVPRLEALLKEIYAAHPDVEQHDLYIAGPSTFTRPTQAFFLNLGFPRNQLHVAD